MYKEFFNLKELPFLTTPQIGFFQFMPSHNLALETVLYALSQGDAFIQIVGEVGCGKTITLRQIINKLPSSFKVAYLPHGRLSGQEIFNHIAKDLDLSVVDRDCNMYDLQNILLKIYESGYRSVLFVDEAQTLSEHGLECLRLLSNIENDLAKLIQIVLIGQPELEKMLSRPSMRQVSQRVHYRVKINKLTQKEVKYYIVNRLISAGHENGLLFTDSAVDLLVKISKGLPRLINIFSHKALLSAFARNSNLVTRDDVLNSFVETKYARKYNFFDKLASFFYINNKLMEFVE